MTGPAEDDGDVTEVVVSAAASAGYRSGWFDGTCLAAEELEARGFWVAAAVVRSVSELSELDEA